MAYPHYDDLKRVCVCVWGGGQMQVVSWYVSVATDESIQILQFKNHLLSTQNVLSIWIVFL